MKKKAKMEATMECCDEPKKGVCCPVSGCWTKGRVMGTLLAAAGLWVLAEGYLSQQSGTRYWPFLWYLVGVLLMGAAASNCCGGQKGCCDDGSECCK